MSTSNTSTQVVVIGGGPGGYAAAFYAADLGMKVTLVDLEKNPGGVCLYRGCIPSKSLLHVAKVISEAREAGEFGVLYGEPKMDLKRLRAWKDKIVDQLTGGLGELSKRRNITYIQGRASFINGTTLKIQKTQGGEETLSFQNAILATGSRPAVVPHLAINSPRVMDSTGALQLNDIPKTMLVVGGGYIGLELGQAYSALGTEVTVVEMTPSLLPGADRDLVTFLAKRLEQQFSSILLNTKVVEVKEEKGGLRVKFEGPDLKEPEKVFEKMLVCVGRKPNSADLGLENTKVEVDQRGFVKVNEKRQTAEPTVYAIGDIAGDPMLAHKASHEGRVAVEAIQGHKVAFEPLAIPAVVFTDPEIAWAGLTETQAKKENREVSVVRFPWGASGRATSMGRSDGVTKLVVDPKTERILGVGISGPGAGELIAEGVLAIEMGAVVTDLKLSIHPHPTLSETVMESAEAFFGHSTHIYRPKR